MARSTKQGVAKVFVALRHDTNKTLSVQQFSDVMESSDDWRTSEITETAEQQAKAFMIGKKSAKIIEGASTAEEAIEMAKKEGI